MDAHEIIALVLTVTAFCSYVNYKFLNLPPSIGVTVIAVILTLFLKVASHFDVDINQFANFLSHKIEFQDNFLHGMLGFLVFANAIHMNSRELLKHKLAISIFSTVSVIISSVLIACATYWISSWFEIYIPFFYCLAFGALISPTDVITVIAVIKTIKIPKAMEMKITGEALFNDGMGIALFFMAMSLAYGAKNAVSVDTTLLFFFREAFGGVVLGCVLGWFGAKILHSIDHHQIAIIFTISLVAGGYIFAMSVLDVSGPICMAVAGLFVGYAMSHDGEHKKISRNVTDFWEIVDQLLNAILFVLIGIELISINIHFQIVLLALVVVFFGLIARWVSLFVPGILMHKFDHYDSTLVSLMVWGGIRGGISIALALTITGPYSEIILTMSYIVVLFSMIVQGLSMEPVTRRLMQKAK